MSVLGTVHEVFKKYKIPEEIYRKIFKYISVRSIELIPEDSRVLSLFYSNKDLIKNMELLRKSVINCGAYKCDKIISRDSWSICHDCANFFCEGHTVESKCCRAVLCNRCVRVCSSEKFDGYYCEQCLVEEYFRETDQRYDFGIGIETEFDGN
jgi:hypothetical protein